MDTPSGRQTHTQEKALDYEILFTTLESPEHSATLTLAREMARQSDPIQQLAEAIEEIENPYVPTCFAA